MKRKCCVPACDSGTKCTICQVNICYFKPPKDHSMIKQWELALGLKTSSLQSQDRVCSAHFGKHDIVTTRFIPLKRPNTNSKMILEVSKLERNAVPAVIPSGIPKSCPHDRNKRKSSIKINEKSCRTESAASVSSESDDTDVSSAEDEKQQQSQPQPPPRRKDYRAVAQSIASRSHRRQIRALDNLRAKWLAKKKNLAKEIQLLEAKIAEIGKRKDEESLESD